MRRWLTSTVILLIVGIQAASGQDGPIVTNVHANFQPTTKLVDIYFDVTLPATNTIRYSARAGASDNGGLFYSVACVSLTGDKTNLITSKTACHLIWNAGSDWNSQFTTNMRFKVEVWNSDRAVPYPPQGMKYIPETSDMIGAPYYMDTYHVSWALWDGVRQWALTNGYSDLSLGRRGSTHGATSTNHPVTYVTWYDCVKWCNARSEQEGLSPCYYTSSTGTVYRTGQITDLGASAVGALANGYRLPTEAEWEKAARGGLVGMTYPWGNSVDGSKANYRDSGDPYDNGTTPVGYYNGGQTPLGVDMANGYGLYDMAGNVYQWTWSFYSGTSGPRVVRGGSWNDSTGSMRCYNRYSYGPGVTLTSDGFRCVRGLDF